MARSIDEKLRITAAVLGAGTRKDLAAHFRRANPRTSFDIDRASKWMQGRAQPRDGTLYEDWIAVLSLDRPGAWLAECELPEFMEVVEARHGTGHDELERRTRSMRRAASAAPSELAAALTGVFVTYSPSWSTYFRGQLIRGVMTFALAPGTRRLEAHYAESLPTAAITAHGEALTGSRAIHLFLYDAVFDNRFAFCLFPPTPLNSVLGGMMTGAAILGPEPQPIASRVLMLRVRLPAASVLGLPPYLAAGASVAADLAGLGFRLDDPDGVDAHITRFLREGGGGGLDHGPAAEFRALVEIFDRHWLAAPAA